MRLSKYLEPYRTKKKKLSVPLVGMKGVPFPIEGMVFPVRNVTVKCNNKNSVETNSFGRRALISVTS